MSTIKLPQTQNEAETQVETQAVSTVVINMPPEENFKVYKYRFVVLAVYSLLAAVFGMEISVEGPLITVLQDIYDQDIFIVTLSVSLIEFIVYVPAGFVANYVLDKYGLKIGVSVGCFFLAAGMWINVFCEHSFWFIFAGSFVAAIGQPFVFNAPQMVSSNWFPPKERALSTAVASMSNPVGAAIGYLISGAFVANDASGETGLKQFHNLMLFGAILGSCTVALNLIFFRDQPPTPPSKSAEAHKLTTCQSLKSLSKNWSYIVFAISASLTWGSVSFFGAMVQPMVYPFGYTITQAGIIATITLACGLVGSLVWAAYVDKSKKFKRSVIICSVLTICFTVFLGAGLFIQQFAITAVATGCMGFFAMPLLSLGFELCAELSFPVGEGTSGGLFVLTSNLVSVFGSLAADAILGDETKADTMYVLAIIIGLQVIALIGFIIFKEDLRRLKADKKANAENNNTSNEENKSDEEIKKLSELLSNSHHEFNKEEVTPTILRSIVSCHL